ncbi:MAG: hypothetical protein ACFFDK_03595 [Promethearchaeota archaeon]
MEHINLSLEYDKNLINKILDDINMRYIILFQYIIRNDLFADLNDKNLIESYERILILDDIFKGNVINFLGEYQNFIEVAIDLGLFKNIRTLREFEQKDNDFILKMGEETITIEKNTIMTPEDTLFLMITKKFKFLTRRNFNLALTRLKGVRCEISSTIHSFIFEIGQGDYTLADDLYYILDQYGNIYQAIKIEITIEGFYQRFEEIAKKVDELIEIFDPALNSKNIVNNIHKTIEQNKDIFEYLKEQKVKLSDKFKSKEDIKDTQVSKEWNSKLMHLLKLRFQIKSIDKKLLEIKQYYSGKNKKYGYLEFIEKVSFNEDNIVDEIQNSLLALRKELIDINNEFSKLTKKEIKLLNLDYERYLITSSDDEK